MTRLIVAAVSLLMLAYVAAVVFSVLAVGLAAKRCDVGKWPDWLKLVDAAIASANENDGTIRYAQ